MGLCQSSSSIDRSHSNQAQLPVHGNRDRNQNLQTFTTSGQTSPIVHIIDLQSLQNRSNTSGTRIISTNRVSPGLSAEDLRAELRVMESFFTNLLRSQNFMGATQQQMAEEDKSPPPASKKALRQIPTVLVTPDDLVDETNRECCICLDENKLGDKVNRLPCGHLFHPTCIRDWLTKHNTCPICRYELETDDPNYEKGRKERMANRKQRFRSHELKRMSIRDLKSLAFNLNLNEAQVNNIFEKSELVQMIMDSGKIDLVASSDPVEHKLSDLRKMGVGELKKTMADGGVFFDSKDVLEKEDMVQLFLNSGRLVLILEENENISEDREIETFTEMEHDSNTNSMNLENDPILQSSATLDDSSSSHDRTPFVSDAAYSSSMSYYPTYTSGTSLSSHSISRLKSFARELNINIQNCVEKQDIIDRIVTAVERSGGNARSQRRRI